MGDITIAGKRVDDPFGRLVAYASEHAGTVRRYDLAGQDDPDLLPLNEVARTWIIASRINKRERRWFEERGADAPFTAVPLEADLGDADPGEADGLYDRADALFQHFNRARPRGINMGKISKVLHPKRPALFPLLDSRVERRYRRAARHAAMQYPARGYHRMYWAAVRDDLVLNRPNLTALKEQCAADSRDDVKQLALLTDLRVMDMLTW